MSIKKTVRRYRIDQEPNDFSYWITKTPQERIDALETIRSEYHAWRYSDAEQRFHRVYRIVKQKQSDIKNKKSTSRSQDQADLEKTNKTTLEAMDDTIHNRNMSKSFDSIDALIDDLHSGT